MKWLNLIVGSALASSLAFAGDFFSEAEKSVCDHSRPPIAVKVNQKNKKVEQMVALNGVSTEEVAQYKSADELKRRAFLSDLLKDEKAIADNTLATASHPNEKRATSAWYGYSYGWGAPIFYWSWTYVSYWYVYTPVYRWYVYY